MKIKCVSGYFIFEETYPGDLSDFVSLFDLELVSKDHYFTFAELLDAPDFSLIGTKYLDADATANFEGKPWDVMKENGLVFNFNELEVVPVAAIFQQIEVNRALSYFVQDGLILPGSLTDGGKRVTDYSAHFSKDTMLFKYSEVNFV